MCRSQLMDGLSSPLITASQLQNRCNTRGELDRFKVPVGRAAAAFVNEVSVVQEGTSIEA